MKARIALACSALLASFHVVCGAADVPQTITSPIPGVVNVGTPIQLVRDGFEATEGPLPQLDGGLLFTDNRVGRIYRFAPDGTATVWLEGSGGANALTRTVEGDIVATLVGNPSIAVMKPGAPPRVLVRDYEGMPFNRPNDLIASAEGQIYFTDTATTGTAPAGARPALPAALYQLTDSGDLLRVATDINQPNGVALSPDERTLYVADTVGDRLFAYELNRKGRVKDRSDFARLIMPPSQSGVAPGSGADGIAVDEKGRVYVATAMGVQVFSERGEVLGVISMPKRPQNLAFAGPERNVLYVVGSGSVYRITTLTHGPHRSGK